jgi:hypothetical protein
MDGYFLFENDIGEKHESNESIPDVSKLKNVI